MTIDLTNALAVLAFILTTIGILVKIIWDMQSKRTASLETSVDKLHHDITDIKTTVAGFGGSYVSRTEFISHVERTQK